MPTRQQEIWDWKDDGAGLGLNFFDSYICMCAYVGMYVCMCLWHVVIFVLNYHCCLYIVCGRS